MISRESCSLAKILGSVRSPKIIRDQVISPSANAELFQRINFSNCPSFGIKDDYAKILAKEINLYAGPIHEIFFNAICWGNGSDPSLPIFVKTYSSEEASILYVQDQGMGFDVVEKINAYCLGESYANRYGGGFQEFMSNQDFEIFYSNFGRSCSLVTPVTIID